MKLPELVSFSQVIENVRGDIEQGMRRIPTGLPVLDEHLSAGEGMPQGIVVPSTLLLGAQPGSAKSLLAQSIARHHVLKNGGFVYFQDFELGQKWFMQRLLYSMAKVGEADIFRGLSPRQQELWQASIDAWGPVSDRCFYSSDSTTVTLFRDQVQRVARMAEKAGQVALVVLDSIQKVRIDLDNRRAGIDMWIRTINELRKDHANLVFIVVSELSRDTAARGYTLTLSAFKESGGLEYTADDICGLVEVKGKELEELAMPGTAPGTKLNPPYRLEFLGKRTVAKGPVAYYSTVWPYFGIKEWSVNQEVDDLLEEVERLEKEQNGS